MSKKRRKKEKCLNCGTILRNFENFCYKCGQENHQKRTTVKMLLNDFSQDYFTFDSKLFKSLKPLLFNPGFLTLECINGRRKNYIRPIRLYLFISFVFFLTNSLINSSSDGGFTTDFANGFNGQVNTINNEVDSAIFKEKERVLLETKTREKLEKEILTNEKEGDKLLAFFNRKLLILSSENGQEGFESMFFQKIPFFLFFTIPVLAFILFLFFYKTDRYYVDHLIFTFHFMSFLFFTLLIYNLISLFVDYDFIFYIFIFLVEVYAVIAAKRSYGVSYFGSIMRIIGVNITHLLISFILFVLYIFIILLLV